MNVDEFAAAKKPVLKTAEDRLFLAIKFGLRAARRGNADWYLPIIRRALTIARAEYRSTANRTSSPNLRTDLEFLRNRLEDALPRTDPDIVHIDAQARAIAGSIASIAISTGSLAAAKDDERDLFKIWVNMEDDRVRAAHREVAPVRLRANFDVAGVPMDRPGDTRAPIELWINCRCILGYKTAPEVEEMTLLDTFTDEGATMTVTATEIEDVPAVDADEISVPWHGVLAPEGVMSGDRRKFAADSLRWRELPLPLAWQKTNMGGHDGSVVVGRIDNIWREDGVIKATGFMLATVEADEVVGLLGEGGIRGVSVDVDDATMAMEDSDGNLIEGDEFAEDASMLVTDGRICGATLCAIPAFQEAHVYLGVEDEAQSLAASADCLPCQYKAGIDEGEFTYSREDYTDDQWQAACLWPGDGHDPIPVYTPDGRLSRPAVMHAASLRFVKESPFLRSLVSGALTILGENEMVDDDIDYKYLDDVEEFVKTEDGPGWLTHPVDTERLRHYWTKGKGALKIRWGIPGDFNRCRTQLAKYIKPQYLSGYCANRHYDALGFWPGRPVTGDTADFSGPSLRLVASAFEDRPPKSWFEDPRLTKGSPIVVTEDGRVFGHLAEWSRCHIGYGQRNCTLAPKSKAQYAFFRTGYVLTDDGEVPVGHITTGTGHADGTLNAAAAASHYDNTGSVVADVAAGEDQYGVWVAGWMRPGTTEEDRYVLRASTLSGDWRTIGVGLELVAALAVNVPGFPIPRAELVAAGGRQVSLVASGIVLPEAEPPAPFDLKAVADAIINEMDKRDRTKRMTVLRAQTGRTNDNRMREIREKAGR